MVDVRVDGAVERTWPLCPELVGQHPQSPAAGEGQIQIEARHQVGRDILVVSPAQFTERHRGIDVVEGTDAGRDLQHPAGDRDAIGHIGAEHDQISGRDGSGEAAAQLVQVTVQAGRRERRARQILVRRVPGHVALEEQDPVAPTREPFDERAVRGGVAVAPEDVMDRPRR